MLHTWLKVHQDGTRDELPPRHELLPLRLGLGRESHGLVVVDLHPLHLELAGAGVGAGRVDAVFIADDLPELGADLVAALAGLQVDRCE